MLPVSILATAFVLTSPEIAAGGIIPRDQVWNHDGCDGTNVAPRLRWHGAPSATKSFALIMFDPDAPTGHGWYHWIVVDLPAQADAIGPRVRPPAREGRNDFGTLGYGGPCPPPGGAHRYVFTLYALAIPHLPAVRASGPAVEAAIRSHVLETATLTGRFGR